MILSKIALLVLATPTLAVWNKIDSKMSAVTAVELESKQSVLKDVALAGKKEKRGYSRCVAPAKVTVPTNNPWYGSNGAEVGDDVCTVFILYKDCPDGTRLRSAYVKTCFPWDYSNAYHKPLIVAPHATGPRTNGRAASLAYFANFDYDGYEVYRVWHTWNSETTIPTCLISTVNQPTAYEWSYSNWARYWSWRTCIGTSAPITAIPTTPSPVTGAPSVSPTTSAPSVSPTTAPSVKGSCVAPHKVTFPTTSPWYSSNGAEVGDDVCTVFILYKDCPDGTRLRSAYVKTCHQWSDNNRYHKPRIMAPLATGPGTNGRAASLAYFANFDYDGYEVYRVWNTWNSETEIPHCLISTANQPTAYEWNYNNWARYYSWRTCIGTSAPITAIPTTPSPVTGAPSVSPTTVSPSSAPSEYGKCPPNSNLFIKTADTGKYSWTDSSDEVFDIVNPDRIDNAGFYESAGWTRRPKVSPARTTLEDNVYVAGATTPVRFILSDQYGNKEYCTINVQVDDEQNPETSTCPTATEFEVDSQCKAQMTWNAPTMTDNQPGDVEIKGPFGTNGGTTTSGVYTGSGYDTGDHPIHYRGYDIANNTKDCNFTMTVVDKIKPAYTTCETAQASYIHECGGLLGSDVDVPVTWTCTATDNCPAADTAVTPDCDPWVEIISFAGAGFHNDPPTVTESACDAATDTTDKCEELWNSNGNLTFCAFNSATGCIEATDKIDSFGTATYYFRGTEGASFPVPPIILDTDDSHSATTYRVSCVATDVHDNTKDKTFQFEVADGRKKPHFTYCPEDSTLTLPEDGTVHTMPGAFKLPTWENNAGCHDDTSMEEASGMSNATGLHAGVHAFSYRLFDTWGNEAYCNFQVTVLDKNNLTWANCPTDQVLETDADLLQYQIATWDHPTVEKRGKTMDAANVTITYPDAKSGMAFPLGVTKLTYTVADLRAHMSDVTPVTCEFTIEVKDRERPEFTGKSAIPTCADGENGVPQGSFCGGSEITITKRNTGSPDDFMYNADYAVSAVSPKSCCGGFTCQSFVAGNDFVKVCK